jgi:hypothetical protein
MTCQSLIRGLGALAAEPSRNIPMLRLWLRLVAGLMERGNWNMQRSRGLTSLNETTDRMRLHSGPKGTELLRHLVQRKPIEKPHA